LGPHPPSPSPKKRERRCIANPNNITTTSTLYHYSAPSKTPILSVSPISVGCALMASSFGGGREEALLSAFEDSDIINVCEKRGLWPHPPSPSPKGKERCCTAKPNFIITTSSVYH